MKIDIKQLLEKQGSWQKTRKAETWGEKIQKSQAARDSLGMFGYRAARSSKRLWSVR
jgi:hypothetical protein